MTEGNLEFADDTNYVIEDSTESNVFSPSEQLNELIDLIKNNEFEVIKEKLASLNIDENILDILLSKGADVHATTNKGLSSLAVAVTHNNINAIEKLLKHGADINQNSNGYLPLMNASRFDGEELIKFLVNKGSLVNAQGVKSRY